MTSKKAERMLQVLKQSDVYWNLKTMDMGVSAVRVINSNFDIEACPSAMKGLEKARIYLWHMERDDEGAACDAQIIAESEFLDYEEIDVLATAWREAVRDGHESVICQRAGIDFTNLTGWRNYQVDGERK